jgi:hypothetical protein
MPQMANDITLMMTNGNASVIPNLRKLYYGFGCRMRE